MHFREILDLIYMIHLYGIKEFTSKGFSNEITSHVDQFTIDPGEISPKRISNDLDRLYRMHFLKRKRRKRIVNNYGIEVNRGFEYVYSLSKQGWNYLSYMHGTKVADKTDLIEFLPPVIKQIEEMFKKREERRKFFARNFPMVKRSKQVFDTSKLSPEDAARHRELGVKYMYLQREAWKTLTELDHIELRIK